MTAVDDFLLFPKLSYIDDLLEDRSLLVLGASSGKAGALLAEYARDVTIVDPSAVRLRYYETRYPSETLQYLQAPYSETGLPDEAFDAVVALAPPFASETFGELLAETQRVLDPEGFLFLSLPLESPTLVPRRSYQIEPAFLRSLLRQYFTHVEVLVQQVSLAAFIGVEPERLPTYQAPGKDHEPLHVEYIAICSQLPVLPEERLLARSSLTPLLKNVRARVVAQQSQIRRLSMELTRARSMLDEQPLEDLAGVVVYRDEEAEARHDGAEEMDGALTSVLDTTPGDIEDDAARKGAEGDSDRTGAEEDTAQTGAEKQSRDTIEALEARVVALAQELLARQQELEQVSEQKLDLEITLEEAEGALQAAEQTRAELLEEVAVYRAGEVEKDKTSASSKGEPGGAMARAGDVALESAERNEGAESDEDSLSRYQEEVVEEIIRQLEESPSSAEAIDDVPEPAALQEEQPSLASAGQPSLASAGQPSKNENAPGSRGSFETIRESDVLAAEGGGPGGAVKGSETKEGGAPEGAVRDEEGVARGLDDLPETTDALDSRFREQTSRPDGLPSGADELASSEDRASGADELVSSGDLAPGADELVSSGDLAPATEKLASVSDENAHPQSPDFDTTQKIPLPPVVRNVPVEAEETPFMGALDDVSIADDPIPPRRRRIEAAMAAPYEALDQDGPGSDQEETASRGNEEGGGPLPSLPHPSPELRKDFLENWGSPAPSEADGVSRGAVPRPVPGIDGAFGNEGAAAPSRSPAERGYYDSRDREQGTARADWLDVPVPAASARTSGQGVQTRQRGELALLEALKADNLARLPSVTRPVAPDKAGQGPDESSRK